MGAVIHVCLAPGSCIPDGAHAVEGLVFIHARAAVEARRRDAVIHRTLTHGTFEAFATVALETGWSVRAGGIVLARSVGARLSRQLAIAPRIPRSTLTHESLISSVQAGAPIFTRVVGTAIVDDLAVGPIEARSTLTRVRAWGGVEAGRSVLARLVVCAIIQVLVAKQTAPSLLAITLPRFFAGAMQASRVDSAFVAPGSLPSQVASGKEKWGD